jgi:uncharacterized membrane-anchored protein
VAEPAGHDAEARPSRQPGWREVLLVAGIAVVVVLGAQVITELLPTDVQRVGSGTPLLNVVLIVGTIAVLLRVAFGRKGG